jgi:hypothetical protein
MEADMERRVHKCPVCSGVEFDVMKIRCRNCDTRIEGDFTVSRFALLPQEHLDFLLTFIRCRGNIKDVEKELGISYPTVRARLDRAIEALGFEEKRDANGRVEILPGSGEWGDEHGGSPGGPEGHEGMRCSDE